MRRSTSDLRSPALPRAASSPATCSPRSTRARSYTGRRRLRHAQETHQRGHRRGHPQGCAQRARDWFDEPRSAGGGRGGGGGGRLAALGGGGAGEVPSAGGGLGSPHGGGGGSEDAPQTSGGGVRGSKSAVAGIVANEARAGGMSGRGVAGLLGEVQSEFQFNPNLRHADQPRFGGEAH